MKRKMIFVFITVFAFLSLSGCKIAGSGLDEQELGQVAEYTAKLLLKHVRGYETNLMEHIEVTDNPSLVKEDFEVLGKEKRPEAIEEEMNKDREEDSKETGPEEKTPTEEKTPSEEKAPNEEMESEEDGTKLAKKISDVYQMKDFEMVYGGSGEFVKFPNNEGYFTLVPSSDMKLFVTTILIKNISNQKKRFVHDKNISYRMVFKSGTSYKPSVTFLENDLKFLDVEIGAGKTKSGVVVFNVPKKENIKEVKLVVSGNGLDYEVSVSQ